MDRPDGTTSLQISRGTIVEVCAGLVILGIAFAAIAVTDVTSTGSLFYWSILVFLVAGAAIAIGRLHGSRSVINLRLVVPVLLHWLAVLVMIHLVFLLVSTGRMANADVGLTSGFILTLGTVLAGVHGNWRMIVLGLALGLLAVGMATVEQYLWVLLGVAILAIAMLLLGLWLTRRNRTGSGEAG